MKQVMDLTSAYNESDEEDISGIEQNFDEEEAEIEEPTAEKVRRKKTPTFSWTKEDIYEMNNTYFVPDTNEEIPAPIEYFTKLFSFDIMNDIIDQTNLYSTQLNVNSIFNSKN
ncbi:uncharacterized protein [Leptinotarsa decemlineata]|uniref:uncharacterized protein n=1 Tax=Leptinotarsa decemlineata TaxID=7539 RepID=UPI003D3081B6